MTNFQLAIWAIPAYTFQGVYEEVQKFYGSGLTSYIATTRYMEGKLGADELSEDERQLIVQRWLNREQREQDLIEWWRASQRRRRERLSRGHSMSTSSFTDIDSGLFRSGSVGLQGRSDDRTRDGTADLVPNTGRRSPVQYPIGHVEIDGMPIITESSVGTRETIRDTDSDHSQAPPAYDHGMQMQREGIDQTSEEEQISKAMELSLQSEAERQAQLEQRQREEEIVLEYMRKASLAEAEMKEKMNSSR